MTQQAVNNSSHCLCLMQVHFWLANIWNSSLTWKILVYSKHGFCVKRVNCWLEKWHIRFFRPARGCCPNHNLVGFHTAWEHNVIPTFRCIMLPPSSYDWTRSVVVTVCPNSVSKFKSLSCGMQMNFVYVGLAAIILYWHSSTEKLLVGFYLHSISRGTSYLSLQTLVLNLFLEKTQILRVFL
jgi:hypothetical protein